MRWQDERYVRVYTRDTGDWLTLSFAAQALFLMLLRKVDRIGELKLGRRGRASIGACIGHPGVPGLAEALGELLDDGCVRLSSDGTQLFVPNFLEAQECAKSPTERKREQRERDAAQVAATTQLSRDVTAVTFGHEMSPRAVPSRAVPNHAVPVPVTPRDMPAEPLAPVTAAPEAPLEAPLPPPASQTAPPESKPDTSATPPPVATAQTRPPRPPSAPHTSAAFFRRAQDARLRVGLNEERLPHPSKLDAFFSEALLELNGDEERLWAAYDAFTDDPYWAKAAPRAPFPAFMKQWRDHVQQRREELEAGAG